MSDSEEIERKVLPKRTSRGKRFTTLVGEAKEAHAAFWSQRAFEEEETDTEFSDITSSEDSSDSDISDAEPDEKEEAKIRAAEARAAAAAAAMDVCGVHAEQVWRIS